MLEYLYSTTPLAVGVILTLTLVIAYVIMGWLGHPSDLPPMSCLPVPLLGHTLYLITGQREVMLGWKRKVGDIFSFYLGNQLTIVMTNYALLNEALIKQADRFSDRPPHHLRDLWKEHGMGIVHNSGPSWKEQRTLSVNILREFGMGKNWLAEKISEEVAGYTKALTDMKGEARDIQMLTNTAVSNVICAILLGKRFDYDDPFLKHFVDLNAELFQLVTKSSIAQAFPWMVHVPGDLFKVKKTLEKKRYMNETFSQKFIDQFRDDVNDTTSDNFIKSYLREMYKRNKSDKINPFSEAHLKRIIDLLFVAGTDTTSTTLLWAYTYCIHYPECQEKIYEEIVEVVGTDRIPTIQDKPKLKYLNAFTLESQRMGSVIPLGVTHYCSQTTHVGGYRIPEGATILPYLDAVLKDETAWKDPYSFRPERFFDKDGKVFQPNEFVPFSLGRRECMGGSLAKMELFLFLSTIIQRFEILPEDSNTMPPLEPCKDLILGSLPPFRLRMKERTSA